MSDRLGPVLTDEELRLLKELVEKPQTISGNRTREGLRRLIEAGYVDEISLNLSDTCYAITDRGCRAAVQAGA